MSKREKHGDVADARKLYYLLASFSIYLQTIKSTKTCAKSSLSTVLRYFSQPVNCIRERFPGRLPVAKQVEEIRDQMSTAIVERNEHSNC